MRRKILALFVLVAFLVFDWSCMKTKTVRVSPQDLTPENTQGKKISSLITKSGKEITFSEGWPVAVGTGYIIGVKTGKVIIKGEINRSDVKEYIMASGKMQGAITADGSVYWILSMSEGKDAVLKIEYLPDAIAVPISDVEFIVIKKTDVVLIAFLGLGTIGIIVALQSGVGMWLSGW